MAFKVNDLMTKIVPGTSPGPRIWACPDDSHGEEECRGHSRGSCPDDSIPPGCQGHSHAPCPDDSIPPGCQGHSHAPCPDDSRDQCPDDSRSPHRTAGRGTETLALLQRQLRERLDSVPEARI